MLTFTVTALSLLITIALLAGTLICARGMRTGDLLYKGGFWFFLLSFLSRLYTWIRNPIMDRIIQNLAERGADGIGRWVVVSQIPSSLLDAAALIILAAFFLAGLNDRREDKI